MLATILLSGFILTGCTDNASNSIIDDNNPDKESSAVDLGTWTDLDKYMDTSVNPGDDFFMYCNGTWWKNTTVPVGKMPDDEIVGYGRDLANAFDKKIQTLSLPTLNKFMADFDKMNQTTSQAQGLYDKVLQESGLNSAKTKEEAWKAAAKLAKAGASMMIRLYPFSKGGTIRLFAISNKADYMGEDTPNELDDKEDDSSADDEPDYRHRHRSLTDNAAFVSSLFPVSATTRSISSAEWPMLVTFIKELGLNPEEVYTIGEYYDQIGYANDESIEQMRNELKNIQNMDVESFKKLTYAYYQADTAFVSTGAMAVVNSALANASPAQTMNRSTVGSYIEKNYLIYEFSKEVGDKLVTADDVLHTEQAIHELKDAFRERINNNTWLSSSSKKNALEKLENMTVNAGRPYKWMPEAITNIQSCTNVLEDLYSIRKSRLNGVLALNGKPTKTYCFHAHMMEVLPLSLATANALYNHNYNCITLLPYYITAPWYSSTQNSALNYESYNTFGHEITHGFDTDGSKFDKNGDPKPLWATQADFDEFQKRAKKLIEWYKTLDVLPDAPGLKANGDVTIPEDIADLGGMELAFQCYNKYLDQKGFKGDQKQLQLKRFFQAYAQEFRSKYSRRYVDKVAFGIMDGITSNPDVHSLDKERVNGVVTNCDGWYNTFNITSGKLYRKPSERVHIW